MIGSGIWIDFIMTKLWKSQIVIISGWLEPMKNTLNLGEKAKVQRLIWLNITYFFLKGYTEKLSYVITAEFDCD